jgi:hypothetical protein
MGRSPTLEGTGPLPAESPRVTLGTYPDYESAQRVIDHLSDHGFPVGRTAIIGTDLRLVETVLGRLTTLRAALIGAVTGAWIGLLIGLLFGIFAVDGWAVVVLTAVLAGAAWGAAFGAVSHTLAGGRRAFVSRRSIEADRYAVTVEAAYADEAVRLLEKAS